MSVLNFIVLSYNTVSLGLSPSALLYIHCQPLSLFLLSLALSLSPPLSLVIQSSSLLSRVEM